MKEEVKEGIKEQRKMTRGEIESSRRERRSGERKGRR